MAQSATWVYDNLYLEAAIALSKMQCPDFSGVDDETIFDAFQEIFNDSSINQRWVQELEARIADLSDEEVLLQTADSEKFSMRIKGPAAYLALVKGNEIQRFTIGPYSTPISFDR